MLPIFTFLMVVCLSSVVSQSQPGLDCPKTNRLVNLAVDIIDTDVGQQAGKAQVVNDCSIQISDFTIRSALPIKLLRRNKSTRAAEDVFVDSIVATSFLFSQIFNLKTGITFNLNDEFIFAERTFILATITLQIPITTTVATTAVTTASTTTATTSIRTTRTSLSASPSSLGTASDPGKVYNPAKLVLVTINSNANYPNPPTTQSVSFYINNVESAVLTLVRGNDYTFSIMGGAQHPFYLTTSIEGGKKLFPDSDEKIFLGNSTTWGTLQTPLLLPFKATDDLPDEFYYQCWNHTRMGWKVLLIKPNELQSNNIPPLVSGSGKENAGLLISMFVVVLSVMVVF